MNKSPEERFWEKVNKNGPTMPHMDTPCWEWTAHASRRGYGNFSLTHREPIPAHRFSWQIHNGAIPDEMFVLHKCDNPPCVNPAHLFLGTHLDNMADMMAKGRHRSGSATHPERLPRGDNHHARLRPEELARGESHANSKLSDSKVTEIRDKYDSAPIKYGLLPKLAAQHNVHKSTIFLVVKRKIWKHI